MVHDRQHRAIITVGTCWKEACTRRRKCLKNGGREERKEKKERNTKSILLSWMLSLFESCTLFEELIFLVLSHRLDLLHDEHLSLQPIKRLLHVKNHALILLTE